MNQDEGNGGEINEARWREAQVGTITRLNQVISTLTDRMERIQIALGNLQGREVLLNEGVENEEDDNVTLLAGHSPRGGRDVGRGRGRVRRREEYLQYESKIEHVFDCNNFSEERKLKLAVAEFCDYAIIWWTSLKSEWRRNYEEPIETWEERKKLMRKRDRQAYFDMQELLHLAVKIEGQLAWEKENSKRYDFKVGGKYDHDKKNKAATSKGKEKAEEYKEIRERNRDIKFWKCQGIGHLSRDCPNKRVLIIKNGQVVTDSEESDHDELVEEKIQENEEELEDGSQLVLVTRRFLKTQVIENDVDDQRDNLFHTRCLVKGTSCSLVIDSGSCTNVVSTMLIKRLLIPTQHHPKPYKLQWLNDSGTMKEFDDVFQDEVPKGLPPIRGIEHKINFILGAVIRNRLAYRANPTETKEIQRKVEELMEKGYIRESLSPCSVPILLVLTKHGTWRMCVDCRAINKIMLVKME
ncbi:uncharacterized protein LOC111432615 [Cucurbita moschata]|uniref:Uncharacterized protein LOC111432615 n=1 Tax=Cucurbita moschata TaxID=3662 RepID=A0A6J1EHL9_CUCMO|nr:uncharacterized protein LOC111432615 [Cucurbita moschata]